MLLAAAGGAQAQTPTPTPTPTPGPAASASPTPTLESLFLKNILIDQKAIWTAPLHLERHDAKWLAPLGVGTMALITTDRITGDEIRESHGQLKPSRIVSYAGSAYGAAGVAAGFYFVGRATHNDRARETGLLSAEAFIDSAIVVTALKEITQRARPLAGRERSEFFDGGTSFPSGHSISAWSIATIVANEYHHRRLVQVAAYGLASAVSIARFTGSNHYLSDVLVGSALGYGIGEYVYHARHRAGSGSAGLEKESTASGWPTIAARYDRRERQYGVTLRWQF
jgi:hypothetical protein